MATFLRTKTARVVLVLVALFVIYVLAGFLVAPRIVRSLAVDNIRTSLGVMPSIGEIDINPLRLHAEVHDFSLPGADGKPLVGLERLAVSIDVASIWRRALVLRDIEVDAPFVHAAIGRDGVLNLLQLRPKTPSEDSGNKPPPRVQIGLFKVSRGLATFDDASRQPAFSTRLEPIEFDLRDFTTGADGGMFDFAAKTRNDERIEWHGHIGVQPLESDGEIRVAGLRVRTIWDYIEGSVNFAVSGGTIDVESKYRFAMRDGPQLLVDLRHLGVTGLGLRPKGGDADWVAVPEFSVGPASLDLARHSVEVQSVQVRGLQVSAWMDPDRSVNLMRLAPAPTAPTVPTSPAHGAAPAWQLALRDIRVEGASVALEDRSVRPAVKIALAPLGLEVKGASLDLAKPLDVRFDTGVNAGGHVALAGALTPAPLAADVGVQVAKLDLTVLQPYIGRLTGLILQSGNVNADLKVRYGGAKPAASVSGNIGVESVHSVDRVLHDDFLNWQTLQLRGLAWQQAPARLELDQLVVRRLYSRTIIEPDSTLNLQRVLAPGAVAASQSAAPAAPPAAAPVKSGRKGAAAKSATAPSPASAHAPAMFIAIHKVDIGDSAVNFSDLSIQPNFNAGIQKLNGTVDGLSSQPGSRAKVDLKGQVDQYSPVEISGELNLLSPALYSDVSMSFRNIELSIVNPYSGKFAGYNISKGKLTTQLHYHLDGRKLDAQHHITIDQLEFGDRTESKEAVSLPVKLAVALLKDRHGVIDLDLPVSGSLDDPKFRIWPIIGQVLRNTLEKIVTAPFALLGSLFSGGPDLQFVDFRPGSADLDASANDRLKAVAKALAERPQLKLDLPIAYVASIDAPALKAARYDAQLRAAQTARPGAVAAPFAQLDAGAQLAVLRAAYVTAVGAEPKYPDAVAAARSRADADAARRDFLAQALQDRIRIGEDELTTLGQQRAQALQRALLTGSQLDPERVFLVNSDKAKAQADGVRLEMSLH